MKKLNQILTNSQSHWVGDGFPVRSIFSYHQSAQELSPFLLLDYGGPAEFAPSKQIRGVGEHPHRGFETVTIVYAGEVEHRDSAGGGGLIQPGDVQWMTAASGLVHEEKHGKEYAKNGGPFEMIQLWVNLPKKYKMTKPRYQGIKKYEIPVVSLPMNAGSVRVIAGKFQEIAGLASTFTPINLWDIRLLKAQDLEIKVPAGHTAALFVLSGQITLNSGETISPAELALLDRDGDSFMISASQESRILFLGGEPIHEPLVGHGPFVMNTQAEIRQAMVDFQNGQMGRL